jgi:hypothetical protein
MADDCIAVGSPRTYEDQSQLREQKRMTNVSLSRKQNTASFLDSLEFFTLFASRSVSEADSTGILPELNFPTDRALIYGKK